MEVCVIITVDPGESLGISGEKKPVALLQPVFIVNANYRASLFTNAAAHLRNFIRVIGLIALNSKLNCLTWVDCRVPAQTGCAVRIATSDGGIPAIGYGSSGRICPTHVPPINSCCTVIGNTNCTGETATPLVGNHISTASASGSLR